MHLLTKSLRKGVIMGCDCSTPLPKNIQKMINNHPCYSEGAHHHYARIHVAVAPACNIQCNYCNRKYDCSNESRPGVTSEKLSALEAVKKVLHVGAELQQLSVVGIAGPGDALANPKQTFETFKLLKEHAPDLKLCLSTNGLALAEHINTLKRLGIDHVTVTINTVDESGEIGSKIYPWIYYNKKRYKGKEAAKILLQKQLEGIHACVENGILVKANSVLIPDINEKELVNVSKKLQSLGVFLHNIMPLLSKPEFGTVFGLKGVKSANNSLLKKVQKACGINVKLMKHCRQCRADAVGLISEDKNQTFTKKEFSHKSMQELIQAYNLQKRQESHDKIEQWRQKLSLANEHIRKQKLSSTQETILVAVTSASEGVINQHFGNAKEFLIYEAGDLGVTFLTHRKISKQYCFGPDSCGNPIEEIQSQLKDTHFLLTAKIGDCPQKELKAIDVISNDNFAFEPIEPSVLAVAKAYFAQHNSLQEA